MKTQKQIICENAEVYGFISQSDSDLLKLINYKEDATSFYNSVQYKAFKELTRRKVTEPRIKITSSQTTYENLSFLEEYAHEEFWVIYLRQNNTIIKMQQQSKGGISGTIVDVRLILKDAILSKASTIILCHNHPSGELNPSEADKQITYKIKQSAQIMDIKVLDHIIISGTGGYFSFCDEGLI
jgi:DNA repair protein RadC